MAAAQGARRERLHLAAVVDSFARLSPAQQLVDRFLLGYPHDGEFRQPAARLHRIHVVDGGGEVDVEVDVEVERRRLLFGFERSADLTAAVGEASAVIVVRDRPWLPDERGLLRRVLENVAEGAAVFAWGIPATNPDEARALEALAGRRRLVLSGGTFLPATWRLPAVDVGWRAELREALVVVVGERGPAFLGGLDALQSLVERRRGGEAGVRRVRRLEGGDVWKFFAESVSFQELLASAVSRSDTPRGDPERDGRTQDIVGKGLLPELVQRPVLALLEHADGLRSAVVRLDGAVRDFNFAVRDTAGRVTSAQLYRPPPPGEHHYDRLAALLDEFFVHRRPPHPFERNVLVGALLGALLRAGDGAPGLAYRALPRSEFRRGAPGPDYPR
ncbi:MAG: hypothetical protein O7J95_15005 [Planctomycetota bacterium]|nr:hypothetical protein [Planctomycetota bacterium]